MSTEYIKMPDVAAMVQEAREELDKYNKDHDKK